MNVTDYTYLMNKPDAITEKQADALGSVLNEFPYFQSARALRLKGLYNQNSFKYNYALKVTAAHTSDRSVLFDFITSEVFTSIQNDFYEQKLRDLLEITVFESEIISPEQIRKAIEVKTETEEQPVSETIKTTETAVIEEPIKIEQTKNIPEIDPAIFLAIKEAQSITFEKPIKQEEPKTLPVIDESIFNTIKEAQSVTYEKPVAEEENKITVAEETLKQTETESISETVKTEETKIDRIENSILSSIKVSETPSITEPVAIIPVEEQKFDRVENSILSSIKEAESANAVQPSKTEEVKEEPIIEEPVHNLIEQEDEDDDSVIEEMIIPEFKMNPVERSILSSIKEAETTTSEQPKEVVQEKIENEIEPEIEPEIEIEETIEVQTEETDESVKTATEHLEIGTPLDFSLNEKHSFQEWLQLSRTEPIDRSNEISPEEKAKIEAVKEEERQKKAEIIDKFIETNPKISPIKPGTSAPVVQIENNFEDNSYLMTETLARVYLEQKKYTKAIQAYEILILKYPEKITFFADRISDIKILQQNNNNNN